VSQIHSTAVVSLAANLGDDVVIGPMSIVEQGAEIGPGCRIGCRVIIKSGVKLGAGNTIHDGAIIGGEPQHINAQESGGLVIGDHNTIRENATIHRGLSPEKNTVIGDHNFIMVNVHIAHDCVIGNNTILANNVLLAGHITIEDRAYLSGAVAVHQFVRIGAYAMVGGQAHIVRDVPPYVTIDGSSSKIVGLNKIGLKRNGFSDEDILQLKAAYRLIYRQGLRWKDAVASLSKSFTEYPARRFTEFFSSGVRGFTQERRSPANTTIRIAKPDGEQSDVRRAG